MDSNIKIVALDIDGVLNSRSSVEVYGTEEELDPVACGLLKKLLKETGAYIVVVSNWRCGKSLDELRELLEEKAGKKIGRRVIGKIAEASASRGELFEAWRDVEHHTGPYVIIDDRADYTADQFPCFVQPDSDVGFKIKDYEAACEILMRGEMK